MGEESESAKRGGIGFFGLLTLIFITLKLLGKITWSWVWVLAPLWGPIVLLLIVLALIGIGALIAYKLS